MAGWSEIFSHKLRLRACGILVEDGAILLARLNSPASSQTIWMPPGGGVDFGESLHEALIREFAEETNLKIEPRQLMHTHEFISRPYHALECYFEVARKDGKIELGHDPELADDQQILRDLKWVPLDDLNDHHCAPKEFLRRVSRGGGKLSASSFSSRIDD